MSGMVEDSKGEITMLLAKANSGDTDAKSKLFGLVEKELRAIAKTKMRGERVDHTLQGTVLIDDAFLRLVGEQAGVDWSGRSHFYRAAARAMRRMLIDHERIRQAQRRGGNEHKRVAADPKYLGNDDERIDLLALDEALTELNEISPRQAQIVELHHFGGYTLEEVAKIVDVSRTTVKADWRIAKAWLFRRLSDD